MVRKWIELANTHANNVESKSQKLEAKRRDIEADLERNRQTLQEKLRKA
jgi:hypothetical protein